MPKKKIIQRKIKRFTAFSLIEVLIVVAIIGLLSVSLFVSVKNNRAKAMDARIKSDLEGLRIAFENYYNDHNCYPPADWFDSADDCNANYLDPYLASIPCDPRTNQPYKLSYDTNQCKNFKLYGNLSDTSDPAVTGLCVSSGGSRLGNYGVSSSNTTIGIDCTVAAASVASSPTSVPWASGQYTPGSLGCQGTTCNNYSTHAAAVSAGCPVTFNNEQVCHDVCITNNPAYFCRE